MVTAYERTVLASILLQRGKVSEAEQQARLALTALTKNLPPDHQYVASAEHVLGEALLGTGQLQDAEAALTGAINRWKRSGAPPWRAARSESALGEVLYRLGRNADAEKYLKRSYTALALDEHADQEAKIKAQQRIRQFYIDRGQREELDALMLTTRGAATAAASNRTN
jgi:tetratricopeptide (TPR) repeat protein